MDKSKKFISITIPTKDYIQAYVLSSLGAKPVMNTSHHLGSKFIDLLSREPIIENNERLSTVLNYPLKLYISYHSFKHKGCHLSNKNLKVFNAYLEKEIKDKFRYCMDFYMEFNPHLKANLPIVKKRLGLDKVDLDNEALLKDYYRYRKRNNLGVFYKNGLKHSEGQRYTKTDTFSKYS